MSCCLCYGVLLIIGYFAAKWIRNYMQGESYKKDNRIDGKIVIVTGANCGIGKITAHELANRGAIVYMACRDMKKAEDARHDIVRATGNKNIYVRQLDLSSLDAVRNFVEIFKKEQDHLDILVNNAGVMRCPLMRTNEGFEMQIGVNHMGHFLLTNLLLDLLKKSTPSRIVVVSSKAHTRGEISKDDLNSERSYDGGKAYSQSKLANVLFTRELAKKLKGTGVTVNSLHPGVVETELGRHIAILNNPIGRFLLSPLIWLLFKTPENGAQTTLYAALEPDLEKVSGMYFSDCNLKEVANAAKDDEMAKWLWAESEKWTKLKSQ